MCLAYAIRLTSTMTDEVNGFYKGLKIDLEIVVKGLSFFIDSPEAHMY